MVQMYYSGGNWSRIWYEEKWNKAGGCCEYELPGNEAQKGGKRNKKSYIYYFMILILDDFYKCLTYIFPYKVLSELEKVRMERDFLPLASPLFIDSKTHNFSYFKFLKLGYVYNLS